MFIIFQLMRLKLHLMSMVVLFHRRMLCGIEFILLIA